MTPDPGISSLHSLYFARQPRTRAGGANPLVRVAVHFRKGKSWQIPLC